MDKALDDDEDDIDDDDLFRPGSKQSETRPKGKVSLHLFIALYTGCSNKNTLCSIRQYIWIYSSN